MRITDLLDSLPPLERERMLGRLEGMQMAQRVCRNREEDMREWQGGNGIALPADCAGIIRFVQVQIGNGQMPFGPLTDLEKDAIWRIY